MYAVSVVFLASVGDLRGDTENAVERLNILHFPVSDEGRPESLSASARGGRAGGLRGLFHAVLGVVSRSIIRESRSNRGMPKYFIFLKRRGFGSGILFVSGTQM